VVKRGETLSDIIGTSDPAKVGLFMYANGLHNSTIKPGQPLTVPDFDSLDPDVIAQFKDFGQAVLANDNARVAAWEDQQAQKAQIQQAVKDRQNAAIQRYQQGLYSSPSLYSGASEFQQPQTDLSSSFDPYSFLNGGTGFGSTPAPAPTLGPGFGSAGSSASMTQQSSSQPQLVYNYYDERYERVIINNGPPSSGFNSSNYNYSVPFPSAPDTSPQVTPPSTPEQSSSWWDDLGDWASRNNVGTRILGGLQAAGGVLEADVGAGLIALGGVTVEFGVGVVLIGAGGALVVQGADQAATGLTTAWTGQNTQSLTSQGIQKGFGLTREQADLTTAGINIVGTMGAQSYQAGLLPYVFGSPNYTAPIQAGEEASGGTGAGAGAAQAAPLRVSNGVTLNPRLPEPVAGVDYEAPVLNNANQNIANSQLNGYRSELQLANSVADLSGETVVEYGAGSGSNGADIVSVNSNGTVTLWDAKFRSSVTNFGESKTFAPGSSALNGAVQDAQNAILNATNITDAVRQAALDNLMNGNFKAITAAQGQVTKSTISTFQSWLKH
jgi:hypothetical protein